MTVVGTDKDSLSDCISSETMARGYKTFFMLNSTELEIFPAHKS